MATNHDDRVISLHGERVEDDRAASDPIEVPYTLLSSDALRGVLESVVLREGTDYGERERTLEQKVDDLLERLRRCEARIVFDPLSQTVDLKPVDRSTRG